MLRARLAVLVFVLLSLWSVNAQATPDFVSHNPSSAVYGEPAGVTMREADVPREDETVDLWVRIGYSFYYTDVAIYYTTDGSEPAGSFGSPGNQSTSVLRSSTGAISFVRNEPHSPNNIDWWKATLPASTRTYGLTVKYKIGAWQSGSGFEVFANNTGCADGTCDNPSAPATTFSYPVRLAWPGRGWPNSGPGIGYPNIHLWKEEAVVGNNYMNVQLDQNGSVYDIYYPSAGCIQGMGTKNEGYVDGNDTFPPGLPLGYRGQMNMNMGCAGLRVDGITYWLTNEGGAYTGISQAYVADTNVVRTSETFAASGSIGVQQYDFCPKGVAFPTDSSGNQVCGIYMKRVVLTNNGTSSKTINFYYFADHALNGGDGYDTMLFDQSKGAMVVKDQTARNTSASGEYNPTSFSDYSKNISLNLASALKLCSAVGGAAGSAAADCWRDSSTDNDQGWIGLKVTIPAGQSKEIDLCIVGGYKQGAGDPGLPSIYNGQIAPALDWFYATSAADLQSATEGYWTNWLAGGTTISVPDSRYATVFKRSLLATALHVDEKGGGVIAGMHNGAYPFVWPRDAVYAAVTFDRTGHPAEAKNVYRFLREVAYRAQEEPGRKGFWYQKYSTDGYMIWTAPQVDETAVVPWGIRYHYDSTADYPFLSQNYQTLYEAARSSSEDSVLDTRLYYDDAAKMMHSNNVWEDSWDDFAYSNAAVERGLRDAAQVAAVTGHASDAALFTSRANDIQAGIRSRLAWDGENTDVSQLGVTYPFDAVPANDPLMSHVAERINGTATDRWGNIHPIVNSGGQFGGLVNRYWGDTYWNGGPWFLSTLWYGEFYARRQDYNAGKSDIDALKNRIDLVISRLGPAGLGAEQMAPGTSLLYPGQTDFSLQAAWPNAWESMSTIVDAMMMFLDFKPDAPNDRFSISPKLPTGWSSITFNNVRVGAKAFSVTCSENSYESRQTFTSVTGGALGFDTVVRIPGGETPVSVTRDGLPTAYSFDSQTGRVTLSGSLDSGAGATTVVKVFFASAAWVSARDVKSLPEGTPVCIDDVVVTRVHADRFNVETAYRTSGLAVLGTGVERGEAVKLYGTVGTSGAERVLQLTSIIEQVPATHVPGPMAMTGRAAGGSGLGSQIGVTQGKGLNNIGLDVTIFGMIRSIAGDGSYIVIDDASGLASSVGVNGIRVIGNVQPGRLSEGDFVRATGSVSIEESGGVYYPLLRVAAPTDIF